MKNALVWLLVIGLAAGMGAMFLSGRAKDVELEKLQDASQKADALRAELEETRNRAQSQQEEITSLRKDREDLPRLRNEIAQLREESQRLSRQLQTAQAQATQAAQAGAQQVQQLQQLQNENRQLRSTTSSTTIQGQQAEYNARIKAMVDASGGLGTPQGQATAACINNLRQLDGAKQQWAVGHNQTATSIPTVQDLAPYLSANTMPTCPAGGVYTINAVNQPPTCSFSGHAIPR